MARKRRTTTRRRSGRRRRRRISGRRSSPTVNVLLIVLLVVLAFYALRGFGRDDRPGDTEASGPAIPPAEETTAPPTTAAPTTEPPPEAQPPAEGGDGDSPTPAQQLAALPVVRESHSGSYERDQFGEDWMTGANGCDVRDQVLAEESEVPVTRGRDGCSVVEGEWLSIYDGYSTPDPEELEIDHMVPLAEAWESGAWEWPDTRRERYANDTRRPDALIAVTAATNQSKSDRDPAEWMPPERDVWCRYAEAWITQKSAWELSIDQAEHEALENILATC
jgi:hypothetical protein